MGKINIDEKELNTQKHCPRCQSPTIKAWTDLTEERKFLVERLPGSADFTPEEREKHRFCTRCWFEEIGAVRSDV
jgi:ribosomal protein S27AE